MEEAFARAEARVRAEAVSGWAQGFLYGVGLAGVSPERDLSEETREALADISEVTRLDLDQVCESCTYQRIRCKSNLLSVPFDLVNLPIEFINIREQCAWAHRDEPARGTAKAERLIAAGVAKAKADVILVSGHSGGSSTWGNWRKSSGKLATFNRACCRLSRKPFKAYLLPLATLPVMNSLAISTITRPSVMT